MCFFLNLSAVFVWLVFFPALLMGQAFSPFMGKDGLEVEENKKKEFTGCFNVI